MTPDTQSTFGCCRLCGANDKLPRSHIIPQFVYRWRTAEEAGKNLIPCEQSRRESDGPTSPMLCRDCEKEFSRHESEFAREVFHPFVTHGVVKTKYRGWLRKFAVSVVWRIFDHDQQTRPDAKQVGSRADDRALAEARWRNYLVGKRPDVGRHEVHLIRSHGRSIQGCVADEAAGEFVYAKLGPLIIVGLISHQETTSWLGTRINAEGKLKPTPQSVPTRLGDPFLR